MFNDFYTRLEHELSQTYTLTERATILREKFDDLTEQYDRATRRYDRIQQQRENNRRNASSKALEKTRLEAPKILMTEIRRAAEVNTEFNRPFFLDKLKEAVYNPETITIVPSEYFYGQLSVLINLNLTAGTLHDYAQGIMKVREELGTRSAEAIASHFWAEKFYGAAREGKKVTVKRGRGKERKDVDQTSKFAWKYWESIRKRIEYSGKVAPFWEILNNGTTPLDSDRGGTAYPINVPTNFVERAEDAIRQFYSNIVMTDQESGITDLEAIERLLADLEGAINYIRELQDRLFETYSTGTPIEPTTINQGFEESPLDIASEVLKRIGERIDRANREQVQKLIDALDRGERLPERISLGGGVRIRTIALQKHIIDIQGR